MTTKTAIDILGIRYRKADQLQAGGYAVLQGRLVRVLHRGADHRNEARWVVRTGAGAVVQAFETGLRPATDPELSHRYLPGAAEALAELMTEQVQS